MIKLSKNEIMEEIEQKLAEAENGIIPEMASDFYNENKHYIDSSSYICDLITEFADVNVDCYDKHLLEWAKYNLAEIKEANEEYCTETKDIIKQIQTGQFYVYQNEIYDGLENIICSLLYKELQNRVEDLEAVEISKEDLQKIFDEIDYQNNIDNNSRMDDICDFICELLDQYIVESEE